MVKHRAWITWIQIATSRKRAPTDHGVSGNLYFLHCISEPENGTRSCNNEHDPTGRQSKAYPRRTGVADGRRRCFQTMNLSVNLALCITSLIYVSSVPHTPQSLFTVQSHYNFALGLINVVKTLCPHKLQSLFIVQSNYKSVLGLINVLYDSMSPYAAITFLYLILKTLQLKIQFTKYSN